MMMPDDNELLRRYAEQNSEDAFAELTRRHIDLAWGTAKRVTGDDGYARDVAQIVFDQLARKARFIPEGTVIAGWIYRAAFLEAKRRLRNEARRIERERKAMELQHDAGRDPGQPEVSEEILKRLDTALCSLSAGDRNAIVLRFLQQKSLAEIGTTLGLSENSAQKRVSRALEKLRRLLGPGKAGLPTATLINVLGAAASQAAPAGTSLAVGAASVATAKSLGGGGLSSILLNLKMQAACMKTKLAIGLISTASVATPLVVQEQTLEELRAEHSTLTQTHAAAEALREENAKLEKHEALARELALLRKNHEELLRLRQEVAALKTQQNQEKLRLIGERDRLKTEIDRINQKTERLANTGRIRQQTIEQMKLLGLAARIYATENEDQLPTTFKEMESFIKEQEELENVDLSRYEFFEHDHPLDGRMSHAILLRERTPRRTLSGKWNRCYTTLDGAVQSPESPDPEFKEWEAKQIQYAQKAFLEKTE